MFTPQRKGWAVSGWQENGSASRKNPRSSLGVVLGRGKGVIGAEETPVPPPQGLLGEKDGERAGIDVDGSSSEDWKRFRESGLLDEKVQLRKNKEVLAERVSALEIERDECLYSMGLLLIEKNEWSSQIEELRQALVEAREILKREQTAHIIVVSELEKREENLKKALGIEKQCVVDLEKALREMRAEVSETKFISENKLANAHALQVSLEEKQLEIESKVHAADARLAEANRKNSEVDRKLEDLEAREHKVQRELSSLNIERKAIEKDLSKQREHLLEWEKELQEKQRRLLDEQKLINEREERANDVDMILKKKEVKIEEARKKFDATSGTLKSQEDDFKVRVRALTVKEKGVEIKSSNLEKKEKDLMAVEEKLNAREREEIQKLLDEHKAILDAKKEDFELEMTKKRRSFDEEAKNRMDMLDKDKSLVKRKEEHLLKREKALDIEADDLKSKEKDLDSKSKALKKWEDSLKSDEKLFQEQRKQLLKDSSEIEASRAKLHNEKVAIEAEGQKVIFEKENLKLTQEEREQHLKLQTELKLEKDECQMMMVSLEKQKEALRQEREMFERDWEVLDEKRVALEIEVKQLSAEREKLEKWRHNEEESLKKECLEARADMQRELEDLRLKKVTFEKMMAQERSGAHAEVEKERADMSREFELFKHGLEMSMQRKQDDVEKNFQEKKNEFERWREVELSHIKSSSESNDLKLRRLEMEQDQLLREKEEFSDQRQKLEADRQEIQKDINTLLRLSKNLKDQREEFAKEKEIFLSAAEQCKACHNCGVPINNFDLLNFQPLGGSEDSEEVLLPSLTDGFLEEHAKVGSTDTSHGVPVAGLSNSGSQMKSWFQRCTGLFKISPRNNMHPPTEDQAKTSFSERLDRASLEDADYEPAPSASFENQMVHFDSGDVVPGELERVGITGDDAEASFGVADSSMDIVIIDSDNGTQKTALVSDGDNNEVEGSSMHAEKDSQPEPFKQGHRHQPSRRAKSKPIRRTHSVRAVVEEAKAFLGEISEFKTDEQRDGGAKGSQNILNENPDAPVKFDGAVTSKEQKRRLGELEPEGSGPHSDAEASFGVADNSMDIVRIDADNGTRKTAVVTDDENNEVEGSSMQAEDSQPEPKQGQRHQPNRRAKSKPIRRTLSVKAVVEDAKSFLGEVSELKIDEQQNGGIKDSQNIPDDNPEAPVKPDGAVTSKRQKRRLGELEPEGSESHSENLSIGQRVKKRQTSSQPTTPRNKRYNLRNTTVANTAAASQGTPHKKGAANAGSLQLLPESNIVAGGQTESNIMEGGLGAERSSFHDPQPSASLEYSEKLLQKSAVQCVMEIQSEKIVQHESQEVNVDGIVIKSVEFIEQIAKDGDDVEGDNGIAVAEQIAEDGDEVDGDDKLDEFSEEMAEDGEEVDADAADTPSDWGSGSEDEDDGHSEKHTASIGKKLWDFFTT